MSARKLEAYEFEQAPESKQTPLYQDYTPEAPVGPNLKEILFFVNIACFCIFMALFILCRCNGSQFCPFTTSTKDDETKIFKIKVGTTTNLFFSYLKRQL